MKKLLCYIFIFCSIFSLCGCGEKNKPENQILKYNLDYEPATLDPQVAGGSPANTVIVNTFEGLTKINEDDSITGGVAASWDTNENFTEYTFHLRDNAYWSDDSKTPVTAQDFLYAIQRAINPSTNSPNAKNLFCIKNAKAINLKQKSIEALGIKVPDSNTIIFSLENETRDLPRILTLPVAMPCNKDFFEKCNGQYGMESKNILYNGPFKIKNKYGWDHYNAIHLVRNSNYHGTTPAISAGISFTIGQNSDNIVDLIKNESLDAGKISSTKISNAETNKMKITSFDNSIYGLTFNCSDSVFSNINIRKAFLTSINKDYLFSNISENNIEKANDIIPDYFKVNNSTYRDIAGNSLFLKENDNPKSFLTKGLSELKLKSLPEVSILCKDDSTTKAMVSSMIEMFNNKLGYYFNMEPVSKETLSSKIKSGSYQLAVSSILLENDSAFDLIETFKSDNDKNIANLKNTEFDKLLTQFGNQDISKAISSLVSAEKFLNDCAIFYPLYTEKSYYVCAKNISGIKFYPYNRGVNFTLAKKSK